VIFESLNVQIGGLQMFFEHQKQKTDVENTGRGLVIVCFNFFEKIAIDSSLMLAPFFLIFNPF
jgi:hypothetical protein